MAASPAKVRQARAFLRNRGISSRQVSPRKLANSAQETGKSFTELLRFLGEVLDERKPSSKYRQRAIDKAAEGDKD